MKIMMTILVVWELAYLQLTLIDADCCGSRFFEHCDTWCCGCGSCNIFCCNCANGCNNEYWHGLSRKFNVQRCDHWKRNTMGSSGNSSLAAEAYFRTIDSDDDRTITLEEAEVYLKNQTKFKRNLGISLPKKFRSMDINNDGLISSHEFDDSL